MRAGILGMHRRVDERRPARIARVAVGVTNGRDRTPEVVGVLGVEHGDQPIVHGHGRHRQQARVVGHVAPRCVRDRAHHRPVDDRRRRFPELRDRGLLRRALGAVLPAERLDLGVVALPGLTGQAGRRTRAELVGAGHHPRLALAPVRHGREHRGHVDAGGRMRLIGVGRDRPVVGARGKDRRRRLLADRDPIALRASVGQRLQRGLVVGVDRRLLSRHELQQRRPRRGRDRRLHRGAWRSRDLRAKRGIAPGDRAHRLEDRDLDDGHGSHGRRRRRMLRGDLGGPRVRVGDDIGVRAQGAGQHRRGHKSDH